MTHSLYLCPICDNKLVLNLKSFQCANKHSFDQAKEGYVNLLPVQHKHSKDPGDNKEMVNARRTFLESGFYQPLRDELIELYKRHGKNGNVLDAGCGEGYYTSAHKSDTNHVFGVDIAKNAVRIAAKKYNDCQFSVASIAKLPFADKQFSWLYSIYAPIKTEEFSRIIKDDGFLITVTPAANHLWELKELIYQTPKQHNTEKQHLSGFKLIQEKNLNYKMTFEHSEQSLSLLAMTPFAFKTSTELFTALKQSNPFICQADFMIRIYQKNHCNE